MAGLHRSAHPAGLPPAKPQTRTMPPTARLVHGHRAFFSSPTWRPTCKLTPNSPRPTAQARPFLLTHNSPMQLQPQIHAIAPAAAMLAPHQRQLCSTIAPNIHENLGQNITHICSLAHVSFKLTECQFEHANSLATHFHATPTCTTNSSSS